MSDRIAVILDPALDGYTEGGPGPDLGRPRWEVLVCGDEGGARALLGSLEVDLLVVDTAAPVDAASVFAGARRLRPTAIRTAATPDGEPLPRPLLSLVQHAVTLPLGAAVVGRAMDLADAATDLLHDQALRRVVGELGGLPSLPASIVELNSVLEEPTSGPGDIAAIISQDVGLTTTILQFVNSPFFGLGRVVTDLRHAVVFLGVATIRTLALCAGVFRSFDAGADQDRMATLFEHARTTAEHASGHVGPGVGADAFCAGLLHVVGDLVLEDRAMAASIRRDAADQGVSVSEMEMRTLGTTHAAIGAYLLLLWGLPLSVVMAVARHHDPRPEADDRGAATPTLDLAEALQRACDSASGAVSDSGSDIDLDA